MLPLKSEKYCRGVIRFQIRKNIKLILLEVSQSALLYEQTIAAEYS